MNVEYNIITINKLTNYLTPIKLIGKGSYGHVYELKETNYVIKLYYDDDDTDNLYDEYNIVSKILNFTKNRSDKTNISNIINYIAVGKILNVFTFDKIKYPENSLFIMMQKYKLAASFPYTVRKYINNFISDIYNAFLQLYAITKYIHCDVKLNNIYLDFKFSPPKFLLGDYTLVQKLKKNTTIFESYNKYYIHPYNNDNNYKLYNLPIYSLGITSLESYMDINYKSKLYNICYENITDLNKYINLLLDDNKHKMSTEIYQLLKNMIDNKYNIFNFNKPITYKYN